MTDFEVWNSGNFDPLNFSPIESVFVNELQTMRSLTSHIDSLRSWSWYSITSGIFYSQLYFYIYIKITHLGWFLWTSGMNYKKSTQIRCYCPVFSDHLYHVKYLYRCMSYLLTGVLRILLVINHKIVKLIYWKTEYPSKVIKIVIKKK